MSKRRLPGEIVRRRPGSGFVGSVDPQYIQVPTLPAYKEEAAPCMYSCGDDDCTEWANLPVLDDQFRMTGHDLFHVSECEMEDV